MPDSHLVYAPSGHLVFEPGGHLVRHREIVTRTASFRGFLVGNAGGAWANWTTDQPGALTAFDADTTFLTGSSFSPSVTARRDGLQLVPPYLTTFSHTGGYQRVTLAAGDKTDIDSVKLNVDWSSAKYSTWSAGLGGTSVANPYSSLYTLKVVITDSATSYANGAALRAATPTVTFTTATLESNVTGYGGSVPHGVTSVTIPNSAITGLSGNTAYIWSWLDLSGSVPRYMGATDDDGVECRHYTWSSITIRKTA